MPPSSNKPLAVPGPDRQLRFHALLVAARKKWLIDGLREVIEQLDPAEVQAELARFVEKDVRQTLAKAGIRDEEVFPTPTVLRAQPTMLGYYRLLLGQPQKQFYTAATGLTRYKRAETDGVLSVAADAGLDDLCAGLCAQLGDLVRRMSPSIVGRDVSDLPLMTIGAQFQGANNNLIGQEATKDVFLAIKTIVARHVTTSSPTRLELKNSAGRTILVTLAADPDVRIEEHLERTAHRRVAIEIKGGSDRSNAHNRAGEAEKSHQKAKRAGFPECWTVIAKERLDLNVLRHESPSTNHWFDVAHILQRDGGDWERFVQRIVSVVGIPEP